MKLCSDIELNSTSTLDVSEPTADETLRLLRAFRNIVDPEQQAQVLLLAERHACRSPRFASLLQKLKTKH